MAPSTAIAARETKEEKPRGAGFERIPCCDIENALLETTIASSIDTWPYCKNAASQVAMCSMPTVCSSLLLDIRSMQQVVIEPRED
jgi:hypothetical protein